MAHADQPRDEAIKSLTERAEALGTRTQRPLTQHAGEQAVGQAYRIIAELIGGVLIGLAAGFIVDRIFRTTPWGLIGGVLLGFALSLWLANRTAQRLMAMAKKEGTPVHSVPFDDDEEQ